MKYPSHAIIIWLQFRFNPAHYMCLESVGEVKLKVTCDRGGADSKSTVQVHYRLKFKLSLFSKHFF